MPTIIGDTKPSIFIRFHVSQTKCDSFSTMFSKITGLSFQEALVGLSKDMGDIHFTFSLPVTEGEDLRNTAKTMQSVFLRLYDFYPAISEKPSEAHQNKALQFIRDTELTSRVSPVTKTTLVNH